MKQPAVDRQKQISEAEAMLGDRLGRTGFAKGLYFGRYSHDQLPHFPSPHLDSETSSMVVELTRFCREEIDAASIDQNADIPRSVIDGLGRLGVLGACLPKDVGGRGMNQSSYCRLLEILGAHCASTALFVNAHHSIGPRALALFGTPEQQRKWLPKMAAGEWISAFALTEPEAGSDAANVQTRATPTENGGYLLNGEKRWITNGSIAHALTVMARTPVPWSNETQVTAFLVTPDMDGFEIVESRMPKMGCRGTATSRLRFTDMMVPQENILGPLGKGLRVALTVLDFGRTTFGASCTGAAKACCQRSVLHVNHRVQFGQKLASFELVKQKIAEIQAGTFAMESATYQTAALIDSGEEDFLIETAMLKVFATESLWRILDHTFQLHGGLAYFNDQPFERMIRDARINTIGEGSNDVLQAFIALVGLRDVGLQLKGIQDALRRPLMNLGLLSEFAGRRLERCFSWPEVNLLSAELDQDASRMGKLVGQFGSHVEHLLRIYQESILDAQYQLARVANCAIELYVSGCVLSRFEAILTDGQLSDQQKRHQLATGRYYLASARRRIERHFDALGSNDDAQTTHLAETVLRQPAVPFSNGFFYA